MSNNLFQFFKDRFSKEERPPCLLTFPLGQDSEMQRVFCDLVKMPHLLLAAKNFEEKKGFLNSMLVSLLCDYEPEEVKLVLLDSEKGELEKFGGLSHALIPPVNQPKKSISTLSWLAIEMRRRFDAFEEAGVRDLAGYNEANPDTAMARLVVVISELAELMESSAAEAENVVCRLTQMGRAAGIHLVVATCRPESHILTGVICANIPSRIAFQLASEEDSRYILQTAGAEKLLGEGDLLYLPLGAKEPISILTCPTGDEEARLACETIFSDMNEETTNTNSHEDPLLDSAIEVGLEHGRLTTSLLQRKLSIGYARAARLLDRLEEMRVVGEYCGAKPRPVLWTREHFDAYKKGCSLDNGDGYIPAHQLQTICESFAGRCSLYVSLPFSGETFTFHADEQFKAASTIKIPLLAKLFDDAENGLLDLDAVEGIKAENLVRGSGILKYLSPEIRMSLYDFAVMMIIVSDNSATNHIIDAVGLDRANAFFRENGWNSTILNKKLFLPAPPSAGADAVNLTTAADLGNMLERILDGSLVSPDACQKMMSIMACQTLGKFSKSLPQVHRPLSTRPPLDEVPEGKVMLVEKGGTLACGISHDAAIMLLPNGKKAVLVMMTECEDAQKSLDAIGKVSRAIYDRLIAD